MRHTMPVAEPAPVVMVPSDLVPLSVLELDLAAPPVGGWIAYVVTVPDPLAADGVVANDPAERTLIVRPAETRGHAALLWRQGHRALVEVEELGGRTYRALVNGNNAPTVWAHGAGRHKIAPGQPADDGSLRFTFRRGDPSDRQLVSTPGLTATITVDRVTSRTMGV